MIPRFIRPIIKRLPLPSCPGCGATLQSDKVNGFGYVHNKLPPVQGPSKQKIDHLNSLPILTSAEVKLLLSKNGEHHQKCIRCLKGNHETAKHYPNPTTLYASIKTSPNNTVLHVSSVLDYQHTLQNLERDIGTGTRVIPVVNKIDLLPLSTLSIISGQIQKIYKEPAMFVSAKTGSGLQELVDCLNKNTTNASDKISIIGHTNVGKSALMNAFLEMSGEAKRISVHDAFGTTIQPIEISTKVLSVFKGDGCVIDTPGLETNQTYKECLMAPLFYRGCALQKGESFLVGELVRVDVEEGRLKIAYFGSSFAVLHRCRMTDFAKDDLKYGSDQTLNLASKSSWDICVPGVGWLTVMSSSKMKLTVYCKAKVILRKSILPMGKVSPLEEITKKYKYKSS